MTKPAHYLRFVNALLLAAAPACSVSSEPPEKPVAPSSTVEADKEATIPAPPAKAEAKAEPEADAGSDAELPFSSGPLMPPVFA